MKPIACLLKTLLLASSFGIAVPGLAQNTTTVPPSKSAVTNKIVPPAPGVKTPAKVEEEPVITGFVIPRDKGGYVALTLENNNFKLSFYDAKKKPVKADVTRVRARWSANYKVGNVRTILNLTPDGMALISNYFVRPPYIFRIYLTFLTEIGGDDESGGEHEQTAGEHYVVDFHM